MSPETTPRTPSQNTHPATAAGISGRGKQRVTRRKRPAPPTRKQLLDIAAKEALSLAFNGQSSAELHYDCGSHSNPSIRWYCVQTRPMQERKAADELRKQGFTVFLPMSVPDHLVVRRHLITPRIGTPRYLFVAFDVGMAPWRKIFFTIGVQRLFMLTESRPAPARCGDVEKLIDMVQAELDGTAEAKRIAVAVEAGTVGRVLDGPYAHFACTHVESKQDGSYAVTVEMFGRSHPVVLEAAQVRW